jgi:hypothetical protein
VSYCLSAYRCPPWCHSMVEDYSLFVGDSVYKAVPSKYGSESQQSPFDLRSPILPKNEGARPTIPKTYMNFNQRGHPLLTLRSATSSLRNVRL